MSSAPDPCWGIYTQYLPDPYSQVLRELENYIKNPYRVDPSLKVEKARRCNSSTEENNFCLFTEVGIGVFEQLDVYSVEDWGCNQLYGSDSVISFPLPVYLMLPGIPYPLATGVAAYVGYSRLYVLQPGNTYVISYVRRGEKPLARVKKFRVTDPDHAEVLEEWSCDGPQCLMDAPSALKRICEEDRVSVLE